MHQEAEVTCCLNSSMRTSSWICQMESTDRSNWNIQCCESLEFTYLAFSKSTILDHQGLKTVDFRVQIILVGLSAVSRRIITCLVALKVSVVSQESLIIPQITLQIISQIFWISPILGTPLPMTQCKSLWRVGIKVLSRNHSTSLWYSQLLWML